MEYRELFHIELIHPYFSDIPKDLVLIADKETKNSCNGLGWILKKEIDGIKVLAPVNSETNTFPVAEETDVFTFYIYPTAAYIQEVTDFSDIENGNMISFTNTGQASDSSALINAQVEKNGIFKGFPAIGNIVISGDKINTSAKAESTRYKAIFKTKSIKWKYYLVSNSQGADIRLESRDEQIRFNEIDTDQIKASLQLNFPNSQIRVFESQDTIPYSSVPIKNIKLLQNEEILISHLPNPQKEQGIQIIKIK